MINRRNVLIGLGTGVAAGGAAIGTGAFSQVEATRDVDIETTGDDGALLAFELDEDLDEGGDTISIDVDDLNLDAKTTFREALTVINNGDENVGLEIESKPDWITFKVGATYDEAGTDLSDEAVDLGGNEGDLDLDIVFDISDEDDEDGEVVFRADVELYDGS